MEGQTPKASPFAFHVKSSMEAAISPKSYGGPVRAASFHNDDLTWFHSDGGANAEVFPYSKLEREVLDVIAQRDLSPPWRIGSARSVSPSSPLRRPDRDYGHASAPPPTEREDAAADDQKKAGRLRRTMPLPSLSEAATKAADSEEEVYPYENDDSLSEAATKAAESEEEEYETDKNSKFTRAMERLSRAWHYFENDNDDTVTVDQTQGKDEIRPLQNANVKRHLFAGLETLALPASPLRPNTGQVNWNGRLLPDLAVVVD